MKRWYVVQTQFKGEAKAERHLLNQGFEAYVPRYRKTRRHARRVDVVLAPLFPRYLFVRMDLDMERWRSISGTVGVARIICSGEKPMAVPDGIIEEIQSRENGGGVVTLAPKIFTRGEPLRITEGAFADRIGLFEQMADNKRVLLLLDLMGREVRITAPLETLATAS